MDNGYIECRYGPIASGWKVSHSHRSIATYYPSRVYLRIGAPMLSHRVLFTGASKSRLDRLQSISHTRSYISNKSKPRKFPRKGKRSSKAPEHSRKWFDTEIRIPMLPICCTKLKKVEDGRTGRSETKVMVSINRILFSVFRTTRTHRDIGTYSDVENVHRMKEEFVHVTQKNIFVFQILSRVFHVSPDDPG